MNTGKNASAHHEDERRVGVAHRDVDALSVGALGIAPGHGHAMRGVLAGESHRPRDERRPDLLQPDQADAGDGMIALELGRQAFGQDSLNHLRVDPEVHEQPALDDSTNGGHEHDPQYGCPINAWGRVNGSCARTWTCLRGPAQIAPRPTCRRGRHRGPHARRSACTRASCRGRCGPHLIR